MRSHRLGLGLIFLLWTTIEIFGEDIFPKVPKIVQQYSYEKYVPDTLRFEVDSPGLDIFLTETTAVIDQSKPPPYARFDTVDIRYAVGQIVETLKQSYATDAFFFRLSNINQDVDVIKTKLTELPKSPNNPRTVCLITASSDLFSPTDKLAIQVKLTAIKAKMNFANVGNVRVIFVMEKSDAKSHPRSLYNLVEERMLAGSKSYPLITDGSYTLLSDSLTSVLTEPAFKLNDKKISLQQLYGRILPDAEHFHPGERMLFDLKAGEIVLSKIEAIDNLYSGGVHIDRQFPTWPSSTTPLITTTDTPSAIASHIIYETINTMAPTLHALNGESGSGKTVALHRILSNLQNRAPTTWSIRIDVAKLYPPRRSVLALDVDQFIKEAVDYKVRGLFRNLIKVNPKKIVLLMDGIDQLTRPQEKFAIETINTLAKKGVNIVLAGNLRTMELLQSNVDSKMLVYQIPDMSMAESTKLLTNIWLEKVQNLPSTSASSLETKVQLYVKEFVAKTFEKTYPKTPLTLTTLAESFSKNCLQYVFAKTPGAPITFPGLEIITDRYSLYQKFGQSLITGKVSDPENIYGVIAFKQIVDKMERVEWLTQRMPDFQSDLQRAETVLKSDLATADRTNIKSILEHSDVQNFFAAKYVTKLLTSDDSSRGPLIKSLLQNSNYEGVFQYVDYEIQGKNPKMILFEDEAFNGKTPEPQKIMKNMIDLKVDNLHSFVYDMLTPRQHSKLMNFYFETEIESFQPRRTFGALTLREYSEMNLFELPLMKIRCSLMCTIAENSMSKSMIKLHSKGQWYKQNVEKFNVHYQHMLDISVTRPTPNLEMVKFLVDHIPPQFHIDYNNLLIRTISEVGELCPPIANYLVQKGAKPLEAVLSDGYGVLHVAVKWNSKNLLQYVVETLHVNSDNRPTKSGLTAYAVAIDANPSPYHTMPGWWNMMYYMVNNVNGIASMAPGQLPASTPGNEPTSRMFQMMITDFTNVDNKYSLGSNVLSDSEMARFMRYVTWNLKPETLAIRRTLVLRKILAETPSMSRVELIELLVHYRGIGPMPQSAREFYENTVGHLFDFPPDVPEYQLADMRKRIGKFLMENINDAQDFKSIQEFLSDGLVRTPEEKIALIHELDRRLFLATADVKQQQPSTFEENLSKSRIEYDPSITGQVQKEYETLKDAIKRKDSLLVIDNFNDGTFPTGSRVYCLERSIPGCRISWQIVDEINDATSRRSISDIRINTDKLLRKLDELQIDRVAFRQMIELSREFLARPGGLNMFTGDARMAVMELLHANDINALRHNQITSVTVDEVINVRAARINIPAESPHQTALIPSDNNALRPAHEASKIFLPSSKIRSDVYYTRMISALSIGKQLTTSFSACVQYLIAESEADVKPCAISAGGVVKTIVVDLGGEYVAKLVPMTIKVYTPMLMKVLPSSTPDLVRNFLDGIQTTRGISRVTKGVGVTFGVIGIAFDAYVIGNSVSALVDCFQGSSCTGRDKAELIISIGFAAVSLAVTITALIVPGGAVLLPLIGLALMALESYVQGLNNVIYYAWHYGTDIVESFILFYSALFGLPIPSMVKALETRQDRVDFLEDRAIEFLAQSNENIVAYAVGIGRVTKEGWIPANAEIHMEHEDSKYADNLSRPQPRPTDNTTRLCLPEFVENAPWTEKIGQKVASAKYRCVEAMVIADKKRFDNTKKRGDQMIFYNLDKVDRGRITGSNIYKNMFAIYNGTQDYVLAANTEFVSNYFTLMTRYFHGEIHLRGKASHETTIDLANVKSVITFKWDHAAHEGSIKFGRDPANSFMIVRANVSEPNLRFIGSPRQKDIFVCGYHNDYKHAINDRFITVDAGGGDRQSHQLDEVIDCQNTVVRPWTLIMGSYDKNVAYSAYIMLNNANPQPVPDSTSQVRLVPKKSQYMVYFSGNNFILTKTVRVIYSPSNNTLMWEFWDTESTTMQLSIEPYRSPQALSSDVDQQAEGLQTIIVDQHTHSTIYPVIDVPENQTEPFAITKFSIFMTVESNDLLSLFNSFVKTDAYKKGAEKFSIQAKYTSRSDNTTALFGSIYEDKILLDNTLAVADGRGGSDAYIWSPISRKNIMIENLDFAEAVDTLIILPNTCEFVTTMGNITDFPDPKFSERTDLIIQCSDKNKSPASIKRIDFAGYKAHTWWRHLHIYWNNRTYVPLYPEWTGGKKNAPISPEEEALDFNIVPRLALYFSFGPDYQEEVMTVTSDDRILMMNLTYSTTSSLAVFRSGPNDLVIAQKYLNDSGDASYVMLKGIIANPTEPAPGEPAYPGVTISDKYLGFRIIFVDNTSDNTTENIWDTSDILIRLRTHPETNGDLLASELIREYHSDMSNSNDKSDIVIDRISTEPKNDDYRAGVLSISGVQPKDLEVKWVDKGTSLALCAHKRCTVIKNWCSSSKNRLNIIAFMTKFYRDSLFMNHLYELDCQSIKKEQILPQLTQRLAKAQKRWELTEKIGDNDIVRAKKCLMLTFAEHIHDSSIYRIFGFTSFLEQKRFMLMNCKEVMTSDRINTVQHKDMRQMLNDTFEIFKSSDDEPTAQERQYMADIQNNFEMFSGMCWEDFIRTFDTKIYNAGFSAGSIKHNLRWQRERELIYEECLEKHSPIDTVAVSH